jgi:NDP-sugar pyrophosphorylase family protein
VVILCGGRGTRLQEHTRSIPKPMVEIGGRPILWHVLQIFLAQGFRRFMLLTWINAGFFCFEPSVIDLLSPDSVLEREPLERLAAAGDLRAFRHEGFWDCMDTYKDAVALNDLWATGAAPWKLWA